MGTSPTIVSENYFKYDKSDYAQSLRKMFGENGYKKYTAKMNSIMTKDNLTNPIAASKAEYISEKETQYKTALAAKSKAANIWNRYKLSYAANYTTAVKNNNGYSLNSSQKADVLKNSGDGAAKAYQNYNQAVKDEDYALSLYVDATHSGLSFNA